MRRSKTGLQRKAIILHNVSDINPDVARVAKNWQPMVETPIKILVVNESQEYLLENVVTYLEEGNFLKATEEDYTKAALTGKKSNQVFGKKRELVKIPKADREQNRCKQIAELAKSGFAWREVVNKLHLHRYPKQFLEYNQIYKQNAVKKGKQD